MAETFEPQDYGRSSTGEARGYGGNPRPPEVAAPADAGGHQGSFSAPADSMQDPSTTGGPYPKTDRDAVKTAGAGGAGKAILVLFAILAIGIVIFYAFPFL